MEEDFDFEEMMAKIVMEAGRKMAKRDAAQQAVERVVDRVGRFNGDDVPRFLEAYDAEMTEWGVDEAMRLEYFRRVAAVSVHKEVKELQEAHESWESFEGALMEAYGYAKPKWVCRQYDGERSATTWPASDGKERAVGGYTPPPEKSLTRDQPEEYDFEALVWEACESVKVKFEAEEGLITELGPSGSKDAEEEASLRVEDGAYAEAERACNGDMGEGVERATLSSCGEWTTIDEANDYRAGSATSRVGGGFGAR